MRIRETLPNFDGALLDNMVDYFTYTVIPAYLLYQADILPQGFRLVAVAAILLASAYQFCQADAKNDGQSDIHYFKGFPDYWNVLALYMFLFASNPWLNLGITMLCIVLVFVPIRYLYPSRTSVLRRLSITLASVWGALMLAALLQYPHTDPRLLWVSLLFVVYYVGLSLYATFREACRVFDDRRARRFRWAPDTLLSLSELPRSMLTDSDAATTCAGLWRSMAAQRSGRPRSRRCAQTRLRRPLSSPKERNPLTSWSTNQSPSTMIAGIERMLPK